MPKSLIFLAVLIALWTFFLLHARAEPAKEPAEGFGGSAFFELQLGAWGGEVASEFAVDTMENRGNWRALRIPLSTARTYAQIPAFFTMGLGLHYGESFEIVTRWPLRRDLEAWYQDDFHGTQTLKPSELDLNVPTEAWGVWRNGLGFVKFGRFEPEISPSSNGLVLAGVPWIDGLHWKAAVGIARYDFALASLNGWLSESEEKAQETLTVPNQWGRHYTESSKTLFLHRAGIEMKWGWLALIEQHLVGGKTPEFRDFSPFTAWHNNFSEGYTKSSTTLELGFTPTKSSAFYWQFVMEDIQSPEGEKLGETNPATLGFLAGYKQEIDLSKIGKFKNRVDVVWTDPNFNNHRLPLLKMQSRTVYRSNYRAQEDKDYADRYIVDYPLGYRRGPDALDLWWNLDYLSPSKKWGAAWEFGWLRQGECELYSSYDECGKESSPSGVVERLLRYDLSGWWQPWKFLRVYLGAGILDYENRENVRGKDDLRFYGRGGVVGRLEI